jgi:integrative and conjugative element protein (TIGR02256 family)
MNDSNIALYNDFFGKIKAFRCTKLFQFNSTNNKYEGEIKVTSNKGEITFTVHIPESYPLNDLKIITNDFSGYPHQNLDGSLCLNTAFVNHTNSRLNLEIEKLKKYIETYYENDYEGDLYEFSGFEPKGLVTIIFEESNFDTERFNPLFGEFKYSPLCYMMDDKKRIIHFTAIAQNLGNKCYQWSNFFKSKNEPVHKKRLRFTNWADLVKILPDTFSDYFVEFCKRASISSIFPSGREVYILLAIGYKIPNANSFEVHWDLILLPHIDFPRKQNQSRQFINNYNKPILWDKTFNASYERFFGRGCFDKKIANKKILIIGTGAIGSTLAEILTRGGVRKIDLADNETIEPGNICRSSFGFTDIGFPKIGVLKEKLELISPYIEVGVLISLEAIDINSSTGKETFEKLKSYEIIFDCTANNEIIQMLTDFDLPNTVIYLSISDKAKEMICVCNLDNRNMIERRNQMLYSFGNYREAEFREGTGCWHPTFEASYFDINQLLNYTIRKLNFSYRLNIDPKSFYSYFTGDLIASSEDIKYIQPELNLKLTIESDCFKEIEEISRYNFPNEFGGILIGSYLNDYKDLVISGIICSDDFRNSPMTFTPDHINLNVKLKELYKKFDGKIEYLGDWHSHPNGNNQFSMDDFKSIQDIAKSENVRTHNPILLIAAYGIDYFEPGFYVYNNKRLHKFKPQ